MCRVNSHTKENRLVSLMVVKAQNLNKHDVRGPVLVWSQNLSEIAVDRGVEQQKYHRLLLSVRYFESS